MINLQPDMHIKLRPLAKLPPTDTRTVRQRHLQSGRRQLGKNLLGRCLSALRFSSVCKVSSLLAAANVGKSRIRQTSSISKAFHSRSIRNFFHAVWTLLVLPETSDDPCERGKHNKRERERPVSRCGLCVANSKNKNIRVVALPDCRSNLIRVCVCMRECGYVRLAHSSANVRVRDAFVNGAANRRRLPQSSSNHRTPRCRTPPKCTICSKRSYRHRL